MVTKLLKKKHYVIIDEIDGRKSALFSHPLSQEFYEAGKIKLAGQSKETYETLAREWHAIETGVFPQAENHLFEAERATDRYLFSKATVNEKKARDIIEETMKKITVLSESLKQLMENEEKNRQESTKAEEDYQQLRNDLLTHSFTYGSALDAMEKQLTDMEQNFTDFKKATQRHDYVEAHTVLKILTEKIDRLKEHARLVPQLFEHIEEEIYPQIEEIENSCSAMENKGYLFPQETGSSMKEKIQAVKDETVSVEERIQRLQLEEATMQLREVSNKIDSLYDQLEEEIHAKTFVQQSAPDLRTAFTYLFEKNRRLRIEADRLNQSYVLTEEELTNGEVYHARLEGMKKEFDILSETASSDKAIYSEIQKKYEELMDNLESVFTEQETLQTHIHSFQAEELQAKEKMVVCQNRLYGIRRFMETQRLPGLPEEFLDLYFHTQTRLSELEEAMGKNRIDRSLVNKMVELTQEDIEQVEEAAKRILKNAALTEYLFQYLNRYKKEHPSIGESYEESRRSFEKEYDYEQAFRILADKLEEIEPGAVENIEQKYAEEQQLSVQ